MHRIEERKALLLVVAFTGSCSAPPLVESKNQAATFFGGANLANTNGWSVAGSAAVGSQSIVIPDPEGCAPHDAQDMQGNKVAAIGDPQWQAGLHLNDATGMASYLAADGSADCGGGKCEGRLRSDLRWFATQPAFYDLWVSAYYNAKQKRTQIVNGGLDEDPSGLGRALAELAVTGRSNYAQFSNPLPAWQGGIWQWGFPSEMDILEATRAELNRTGDFYSEEVLWWAVTKTLDHAYKVAAFIMGKANDRDLVAAAGVGTSGRFWAVSGEDNEPHRPVNVSGTPFPQYTMNLAVTNPMSTSTPQAKLPPIAVRYSIASAWNRVATNVGTSTGSLPNALPPYTGWTPADPESMPAGYPTTGKVRLQTSNQIPTAAYAFGKGSGSMGGSSQTTWGTTLGTNTFPVVAGRTYTVSTCGRFTGDTVLRVLMPNLQGYGVIACQNDDALGACGTGSQCTFTALATGTAVVQASTWGQATATWQYTVVSNEPVTPVPTHAQCIAFNKGPRVIPCPEGTNPTLDANAGVASPLTGGSPVKQILQLGPDVYPPNNVSSQTFLPRARSVPTAPVPVLEWDAEVIVYLHGSGSAIEEGIGITNALHQLALGDGTTNPTTGLKKNYTVITMDIPGGAYSQSVDASGPNGFAPWFDTGLGVDPMYAPLCGLGQGAWCPFTFMGNRAGVEGRPRACSAVGLGCYDFDAGGMHNAPVFKYDENMVVDFLNQLDAELGADSVTGKRLKDKLVAIVGGSLGGNLAFTLGRRSSTTDPRYAILPPNVVPYSVTQTVYSAGDLFGDPIWNLNHVPLTVTFGRAGMTPPGQADQSVEQPSSRGDFYRTKFDAPANTVSGPPSSYYWMSNSFACKQSTILGGRIASQETYSRLGRLWHWRLSGDELLYSQQQSGRFPDLMLDPAPGHMNYKYNFRNTLLIAANDDSNQMIAWNRIWNPSLGNPNDEDSGNGFYSLAGVGSGLSYYAPRVASQMFYTPGQFRNYVGVGHSIHFEKPGRLAQDLERFLNLQQFDPYRAGASPCINGRLQDGFGTEFTSKITQTWDAGGVTRKIVGCDNRAFWPSACNYGYHVCSAQEWVQYGAGQAPPLQHYWTDTPLNRGGYGDHNCWVTDAGGGVSNPVTSCGNDNRPAKVCEESTYDDGHGATCTWSGCGFGSGNTANRHFGGCGSDIAGTLCCKD